MDHYILIIILMIGAGMLGGITNYFRIEQEKKGWFSFLKNVLLGICASILIPLFLNMISSNLFEESHSDTSKLFILFGFFLIASLSSKVFIETLSQRLIKEFEKTKEKVDKIEKSTAPIIDKETEPEEKEDVGSFLKERDLSFNDDAKAVLKALAGKYAWRTLRGIARETGIAKENVLRSLNSLSSNGLVETSEKERWALTLEGRDVFMGLSFAEKSNQKEKE
jgi:predicted transcriptional regulator